MQTTRYRTFFYNTALNTLTSDAIFPTVAQAEAYVTEQLPLMRDFVIEAQVRTWPGDFLVAVVKRAQPEGLVA